jgi:hypothetical protein
VFLKIQITPVPLDPEDEGIMLLLNVGNHWSTMFNIPEDWNVNVICLQDKQVLEYQENIKSGFLLLHRACCYIYFIQNQLMQSF